MHEASPAGGVLKRVEDCTRRAGFARANAPRLEAGQLAGVEIAQRGDACPQCGGYQLQPTGGPELRVVEMRVEDA